MTHSDSFCAEFFADQVVESGFLGQIGNYVSGLVLRKPVLELGDDDEVRVGRLEAAVQQGVEAGHSLKIIVKRA